MNEIDAQVEAVVALIKAAGGSAGVDPNAPDHVKKAFIKMVLDCPDCRAAMDLKSL